jgi:hypothetical protein
MPVVANILSGPFADGATVVYKGLIVDYSLPPQPIPALDSLSLSIIDIATGEIVNGVSGVNVLNTGRGLFFNPPRANPDGSQYNVQLTLVAPGDTAITTPTLVKQQRGLVLQWAYNAGVTIGRHQVNFWLTRVGSNQSENLPGP